MSSYIQIPASFGSSKGTTLEQYSVAHCHSNTCPPDTCDNLCITGCNQALTQEQNASESLCCHYHTINTAGNDEPFCCDTNCGQVENMANCALVVKDNDTSNIANCHIGGRYVCSRSCSERCPVFPAGNITAKTNFVQYQTAFQPYGALNNNSNNCERGGAGRCAALTNDTIVPWQNCVYDVADFQNATLADITTYQSTYNTTDRNYDEIMTQWCSEQVTGGCAADPISNVAQPKCARIKQSGAEGDTCRTWLNNKPSGEQQNYIDAVGFRYCSDYNTAECLCINRGTSSVYQQTKQGSPYNDGCWFNPCTGNFPLYFVPSDVNTNLNPSMCPQNVCVAYAGTSGYVYSSLQRNKAYINCSDF